MTMEKLSDIIKSRCEICDVEINPNRESGLCEECKENLDNT